MAGKKRNKKKLAKKWLHEYRLVVLNEDTFEERFSYKLTRLNVFVAFTLSAILLIALTTVLIAFTPIREYIPGYSSTKLKNQAVDLTFKTDSLQKAIALNNQYYNSIRRVLSGEVDSLAFSRENLTLEPIDPATVDFSANEADSLLRIEVEQEEKFNTFETNMTQIEIALFPPVKGSISSPYNIDDKHYAVDVVTTKDAPVKAAADGTVIFSEWSSATGYVILVEHDYGLISVYKHNSSLSKEQGEVVKAGEVIAIVGNTGELTTGPHLHFELWIDGYPVDPTNYINFE
ncbi:M23 family metallopeptidase [Gangjinia marincola]|uniref:M23 family metallopeptidase n=1 Tax=Gangjinia marincola TaxID=578463 RepID=A0ABN1MI03_9FLAO